jgi:PAS domain S-box-containing protein
LGGAVLFLGISNPLIRDLEENEQRYKQLFEGVDDAVMVYSLGGRFLDCNMQALKRLGYSRAEFLQMSVTQILRSDNDPLTASVVVKMQYGGHVMLETVHVAKDGLEIPVEINSRIIDYRGQRAIMMVARDITERKRSEEALRNLQERLQSILNYAPMYIHIVDLDDRYLIANPLYAAFFRVRSNDIVGKHLRDVIPEDHAAENVVQNAKIRETGHPASFEDHFAFSNDTILVLETIKFPILDEQGRQYAVGAVTSNITERRKAESERAGFDQILESTLNEIYVFDAETLYFVRVNQGAQNNLGYSTDELHGMTPVDIKPELDAEMFEERLQPLRNGEKEQIRFTAVHKRKDGSLYPVEVYLQLSEYQLVPVFVAVIIDITDRKKAEEALERRLKFETLVTNVSTNFINCPVETIDEGITATLEEIAAFFGANRGLLILFSDDMRTVTNTHGWRADPADSPIDALQKFSLDRFDGYVSVLKRLEPIVISKLEDIPPDWSAEREWAEQRGLRSLLRYPMAVDGALYGAIGLDGAVGEELEWPEDFDLLLSLVSDSFVGALKRKKAEEELQSAKEYAENLIRTANVMIVALDVDGTILEYNETAEKISGYTRQELEGKNWFEVLVPRDKYPDVWDEFVRLIEGGLPDHFSNLILTKDGKERIISWRNSVLSNHGEIAGTISFGMDITAQKNAEKDLRKHSEDLARSNAELERFAYVASHDLQEPLRMVASYTQLLAKRYEGQLDSDADDFIHFAVDGATRMQRLIDDLLSYSRVGTRGSKLESIDCDAVLEETLLDINNLIRESGATVTCDPLPVIDADAIQLGQLFLVLTFSVVSINHLS